MYSLLLLLLLLLFYVQYRRERERERGNERKTKKTKEINKYYLNFSDRTDVVLPGVSFFFYPSRVLFYIL